MTKTVARESASALTNNEKKIKNKNKQVKKKRRATTATQVASLTQTKSMNAVVKKNNTNKLVRHKQQ